MKKALFIDRDGTLVVEPPVDFQVDSLEKLEYLPGVFRNLYFIRQQLDYELIMVSNQDGMGRPQYPEEIFNLVQDKILTAFKNEGILFDRIHIDSSLPEDDLPSRKPGTAMLTVYMEGDYDLANSFVIGDRLTDIELARNLGAKAILIGGQDRQQEIDEAGLAPHCSYIAGDWSAVYVYLLRNRRRAQIVRETTETRIRIDLSLDGTNRHNISTGIGFFDHMLEQIARHGGVDLEVEVTGDLHVDEHHSIEDTGLALGEAVAKALGDRRGIERYGFLLPMDESEAKVSMDLGGRSTLVWKAAFSREKIGDMPTEMFEHFFKSFSDSAKCNLHIEVDGKNEHHKAEAIFKAFAKVLQQAVKRNPWQLEIPSTKGAL
ncbi:MAG: imidazoleglycerol-phosphate dehydratase [Bacteroides sp. SM23_62]|nr:MAG: imidazoleglycerol-phosphate dehydratase [Bacteroides sp. SM23_62]